jgi:hypothetical protein
MFSSTQLRPGGVPLVAVVAGVAVANPGMFPSTAQAFITLFSCTTRMHMILLDSVAHNVIHCVDARNHANQQAAASTSAHVANALGYMRKRM